MFRFPKGQWVKGDKPYFTTNIAASSYVSSDSDSDTFVAKTYWTFFCQYRRSGLKAVSKSAHINHSIRPPYTVKQEQKRSIFHRTYKEISASPKFQIYNPRQNIFLTCGQQRISCTFYDASSWLGELRLCTSCFIHMWFVLSCNQAI